MTDPVRSGSVVPITVPITSPHGTAGVTQPEAAVIQHPTPADADYHPATFADDAITFSVGPGTDIGRLPQGRSRIFVRFHDGAAVVELAAGDLDVDTAPVLTPDDLAARLALPTPITDAQRALLDGAITDATADVEAYLGRPITPRVYAENNARENWNGTWNLPEWPVIAIISTDPVPGRYDLWTVTYLAGLDAANDPDLAPIKRWVTAAAMNAPQVLTMWWQTTGAASRQITSLSVEGQTVAYTPASLGGGGTAGSGSPGALPSIKTLSRWKVAGRRVFQRPGIAPDPLDAMGVTVGRARWL